MKTMLKIILRSYKPVQLSKFASNNLMLKTPHNRAFTLIEIIVALAIATTATLGVTLVIQTANDDTKLIAAADELAILLRTLSAHAAVAHRPAIITVIPGTSNIHIKHITCGAAKPELTHTLAHKVIIESLQTPDSQPVETPTHLTVQPTGYICDVNFKLKLKEKTLNLIWNSSTRHAHKKTAYGNK